MKIIYAGTPDFAVSALQTLIGTDHQVIAVYTQPDRPSGRGRKLQPSPVKSCALNHGISVFQPLSFTEPGALETLQSLDADLMVVAAYGLILPTAVLNAPRLGCINIHASLLPRWRGAAPIQRAIQAGDGETGITLMQMDEGLDTGDMLAHSAVIIEPGMNAAMLHDRLVEVGGRLLLENLEAIEKKTITPQKQDDTKVTYAHKLNKSEANIDWNRSAEELQRDIWAFNPWPVCFSMLDKQTVKLWNGYTIQQSANLSPGSVIRHGRDGVDISCGEGVLRVTELQFPGKKRQPADQLLNGRDLTGLSFQS